MNTIGQKIASTRNKRSKEIGKIKEDLAKQVGSFTVSKKYKNAVVKIIQMDLDFVKIAQNPENFFEENELEEGEIQEFVNGCKSISEKIIFYNDKVRGIIKGQREETLENETEELKKLKNQEIEVKEMIVSKEVKIGKLQAKLEEKPSIIQEEKIVVISEKARKTNIEIVSETIESGNIHPRIRNKLLMRKLTLDEIIEDMESSEEFQKLIPITLDIKNKTVNLSKVKHPNSRGAIYKGLLLVSIFGKLGRDIGYELTSTMPKRDDAINILKQIFEKRGYSVGLTEIINEKPEKKETEPKEEKVEENGDTKLEKDISKEIIVENFRDDFFRFIKEKVEKIEGKYSINGELKYLLLLPDISKEVFLNFIKNLSESDKHELKLFYPLEADVLNLIDCLVQEKISYLRKIVKDKSQHKEEKISKKIEQKEKNVSDILNEYIGEFLENEEIDFLLSFLDESGKILGKIVDLNDQEEISKMEKNIEKVTGPYIYIKYLEKYREVFFELLITEIYNNIKLRKLLKKSHYSRIELIQIFNKYTDAYIKDKENQLQEKNKKVYEVYEKSTIKDYLFQKRIGIPSFIKEKCSDKYAAFSNLLITELNGEINNEEEIYMFFLIAHEKDIKNDFIAHTRDTYIFGEARIRKELDNFFELNKNKLGEQLANNKKHLIENFEKIEKTLSNLRKDISPSGLSEGNHKKSQKNGKGSGINAVMVRGILDSYLEGFKNKAGLEDIKLDDDLIANFKDFINPTVTQFLSGFSKDSDLTSGKAGIANFFSEQKQAKTKKMLFVDLLRYLPDAIASLGGRDANFSNKLVEKIQEFNDENLPKIEENLKQIQEILDNLKVVNRIKELMNTHHKDEDIVSAIRGLIYFP